VIVAYLALFGMYGDLEVQSQNFPYSTVVWCRRHSRWFCPKFPDETSRRKLWS